MLPLETILAQVARAFDVSADALQGRCRCAALAIPRLAFLFLAAKYTDASHQHIAAHVGRARTMVVHARQVIQDLAETDPKFAAKFRLLCVWCNGSAHLCPKCGQPYNPAVDAIITCPDCEHDGSTACCNPGGKGVPCLDCEAA